MCDTTVLVVGSAEPLLLRRLRRRRRRTINKKGKAKYSLIQEVVCEKNMEPVIDSQSDRQDGAVGTEEWTIPTIHILGMVERTKT